MIFVDADAYIGLMVEADSNHTKAINTLEKLKDEDLMTSWDVMDEVSTKLSYFVTRKVALDFLKIIMASKTKIVFVDEIIKPEVVKLFGCQTSKRVSMTDCANMAIAKKNGVKKFFSFDKHYIKNGFGLVGELVMSK